jgi:hypothetical protein
MKSPTPGLLDFRRPLKFWSTNGFLVDKPKWNVFASINVANTGAGRIDQLAVALPNFETQFILFTAPNVQSFIVAA